MKFRLLFTLLLTPMLCCSMLSFAQGTGEVIITEIHNRPQKPTQVQLDAALPNNPAGANTTPNEGHTEWFEIYNTTSAPVVMDGWTLTDASSSSNVSTISNFTIAANSYAVFSGFDIPDAQGGVVFDYFYDYKKPSFNNESSYDELGDTSCPDGVVIQKADGTLVDEVRYDYGYGNYIGNSSSSSSCSSNVSVSGIPPAGSSSRTSFMLNVDPAIMNSADNDVAANWSYSTIVYDDDNTQKGTPGLPNDGIVLADNDNDTYFSDVDCDDDNPAVNPGATEIPGNGIDDDCDPNTVDVSGPACTGEVIITEIHNRPLKPTQEQLDAALPNNPSGADTSPNEGHTEWFEIYNTTSAPVVMDGWTITDGSSSSNVSTIGSFTIAANSYAVFAGFNIPDAQGGVVFDYFYEYKKPSFNNESSYNELGDDACPDGVVLQKADGTLVDQVLYDYGYGFYIGNASSSTSCSGNTTTYGLPPQDGNSKTSFMLNVDPAIMNCSANDVGSNWSYSTEVYDEDGNQKGTPGLPNDGLVDNDGDGFFSDVDCDDDDENVNSGATEVAYNGIDDDCDESTPDDDLDGDGFGIADDCDDDNAAINPGVTEIAYNGIDDDCDESTPDDDLDGDGFGIADDCDETNPMVNSGATEIPYNGIDDDCNSLTPDDDLDGDTFDNDIDCDDNNAAVFPGATEVAYNGIDDDCDESTPDDDLDGDGFAMADDCNDGNSSINPGASEIAYNGIDDDCDESTADDDLDGDGFAMADDCDDNNSEINSGVTEVPYNGIDDDCDESTADDDLDGDGFGIADDCNDNNPDINPGEVEILNNGINDDCNGNTLDSGDAAQSISRGDGALFAQFIGANGNETYTWFDANGNVVGSFTGVGYFSPTKIGCYTALVTDPDTPGTDFFYDEFCITSLTGCCGLDSNN